MSRAPTIVGAGGPLALMDVVVGPQWVNGLGHMRAAEYVCRFDEANTALFVREALTNAEFRHGGTSPVLIDLHARYLREVGVGDVLAISAQVLEHDAKRVRLLLTMSATGAASTEAAASVVVATCTLLIACLDLTSRRTTPWSAEQAAIWRRLAADHPGPQPVDASPVRTLPEGGASEPAKPPAKVPRRASRKG